jgi:hypothetical protein
MWNGFKVCVDAQLLAKQGFANPERKFGSADSQA